MFELIKPNVNIDFMRLRPYAFAFSALITLLGMVALVARGGPNYGVDFTGGVMLHIAVDPSVEITELRSAVEGLGEAAKGASVQDFGSQPGEYLVRLPSAEENFEQKSVAGLKEALAKTFESKGYRELRTEIVGPRVGSDLRFRGVMSVLLSTVAMGLYIAFRFDLRFGLGAAVALVHDVLVAVGALAITNTEVDLTVVAALLTVVGYSVNDTVVVSDRIRENMHHSQKEEIGHLINRSINETLSRTVLTGGTTLLVLVALFVLGGGVIHGFAFTLIVGIIIGTYSSVFIASPIVEMWKGGASPSLSKSKA